MAKQKFKKSIKSIIGKPGLLHKATGTPMGKKISPAKLASVAKGGGSNAARAQLLLNIERSRKGKKSSGPKSTGSKGRSGS